MVLVVKFFIVHTLPFCLALVPYSAKAFRLTQPYTRRNPSFLRLHSQLSPDSFYSDDEWHPNDPAYTTPQLLVGIWDQIAMAKTLTKDVRLTEVVEVGKINFYS
jgi:hypothetical protein